MKIFLAASLFTILTSCSLQDKQYPCEAFDLNKLPVDTAYLFKSLTYSNGTDTLTLVKSSHRVTQKTTYGQFGVNAFPCEPEFDVYYTESNRGLRIRYFYAYNPEGDGRLFLRLSVNSSDVTLPVDSMPSITSIFMGDKYESGRNLYGKIERIQIKDMRVTAIEMSPGNTWELVQVGDSSVVSSRKIP